MTALLTPTQILIQRACYAAAGIILAENEQARKMTIDEYEVHRRGLADALRDEAGDWCGRNLGE